MPASSAWSRCSRRAVVACATILGAPSCTLSSLATDSNPAPAIVMPAGTRLQVWRGGSAVTLRDVTMDADSIRGREVVPLGGFSRARIAIARCDVDSLRPAPRERDNWFGAGVALGIVGAIAVPYLARLLASHGT